MAVENKEKAETPRCAEHALAKMDALDLAEVLALAEKGDPAAPKRVEAYA